MASGRAEEGSIGPGAVGGGRAAGQPAFAEEKESDARRAGDGCLRHVIRPRPRPSARSHFPSASARVAPGRPASARRGWPAAAPCPWPRAQRPGSRPPPWPAFGLCEGDAHTTIHLLPVTLRSRAETHLFPGPFPPLPAASKPLPPSHWMPDVAESS